MSDPKDMQVLMKIPEEVVRAQVQAAVVAALARDPEKLVRAVVDAALHQKQNSYDRETIWDGQVHAMIRAVATDAFKEWVEEQRPKIRAAVRARLDASKSKTIDSFADKLVDGVLADIKVSFHLGENRY
jgi:hypothetical protein